MTDLSEYDRALSRKRAAAGVLFFDSSGRVMIVDPVYKECWEIPGGAVEKDESPRAGARREVREELGLDIEPGRLLSVDWTAPRAERSEGIAMLFDGGELSGEQLEAVRLQPEELRAFEFASKDQLERRLIPVLARRVKASIDARRRATTVYLENGSAVG
ncbi:NUDIX domain-containing protein [Streptomyces sp. NBC_00859]|uniref:NUDIX domain-containing protein n=1 Tax=Streptomyces sp. NBC_00859 TaxID=2903682 RepID=UPI0038634212|nr:NUDIX hydrolase [Streptomyces sp. NBC_00859]